MNQLLFGFIVGVAFCANSAAEAASAVTENIAGVVAGQHMTDTTDTAGHFGVAGANLSGSAFTLAFDHVPADYNVQGGCAHNYSCTPYQAFDTELGTNAAKIALRSTLAPFRSRIPETVCNDVTMHETGHGKERLVL